MNTLVTVLTLFPLLLGLAEKYIVIAETDNVDGETKKEIVKEAIIESLKTVEMLPGIGKAIPWGLITPVVGMVIDIVVRIYNLTGKFKKKGNENGNVEIHPDGRITG